MVIYFDATIALPRVHSESIKKTEMSIGFVC